MSWQVPNINGQLSSELVNSGWTIYKSTQSGQGNLSWSTAGGLYIKAPNPVKEIHRQLPAGKRVFPHHLSIQ